MNIVGRSFRERRKFLIDIKLFIMSLTVCSATTGRPKICLGAVSLRPTTVRVRKRDGTILTETRVEGGYEATVVGREEEKPQYVRDQEAGISCLTPKVFCPSNNRWVPAPAAAAISEEAVTAATPGAAPLKLVTFNVWFDKRRQERRARALLALVEREDAHFVCLQEVTPLFLGWLREAPWVRARYALSDAVGTTLRGSFTYGVLLLVRRDVAWESCALHALPTRMNRAALVARATVAPGLAVRVATAHLESLDNAPVRDGQLALILDALRASPGGAAEAADGVAEHTVGAVLLAGDMNFDEGAGEEARAVERGFADCWGAVPRTAADDALSDGCTMPYDDVTGRGSRIDRVFALERTALVPCAMRRLGMDPLVDHDEDAEEAEAAKIATAAPAGEGGGTSAPDRCNSKGHRVAFAPVLAQLGTTPSETIDRPSDHYGLCCEFMFRGSGCGGCDGEGEGGTTTPL